MNFYVVFADANFSGVGTWTGIILGCLIYVGLIVVVIIEPIHPLKKMS